MALKSRLELEVDGRSTEQQVNSVRVALEALTQVGIRTQASMAGVFNTINSSVRSIAAAAASVNAANVALAALGSSGARATATLSAAASSFASTSANAAAAEARLAAATRAMNELQQSSLRTTAALNGVGGSVTVTARNATGAVGGLNNTMGSLRSTAMSLAGPLLGLFGGAQLTSSIYAASEAYSTLTNRMKLVTDSAVELAAAQSAVFKIAQSAYQPLSATAELYQRIATNQKELKLSGEGVAGVVGTISKTLAISGASAASANAALIQLGQAFASGTLHGEELNSVMEQAPALAQAIARGMGKTVGELRTLGAAGLLTAETVVKALQAQEKAVEDLFNKTAVTIGNSLTATGNSLTQLVGNLDQASGASAKISAEVLGVSKYMDSLTGSGARVQETLNSVTAILNGAMAGALTLVTAKTLLSLKAMGSQVYAYYASRTAAIAAAEAQVNKSRADVIAARTALDQARADAILYKGTILQTVATGRLAQAKLNLVVADKAATAATNSLSAAQGTLLGIQGGLIGRIGGLLGVLGGPAGLAVTVATVVGSYFLFRDGAGEATQSLIDQNLAVDEATKKFKELSAEQKRYQEIEWIAKQKEATEAAVKSVQQFTREGTKALAVYGYETNQYRDKFLSMLDEVRGGTRSLDSVTQWAKENTSITSAQVATLAQLASEQSANTQLAQSYAQKLGIVTGQTDAVKKSTQALSEAHADSGKQTRAQAGETDKLIAKLKEEVALYGASEKVIAAYNAEKLNMNAEQKEQVRILGSIKDAQEVYKKAVQENDKVQQEAARKQLVVLFTQQQKAEDVATAVKKSHDDAAKAAEESAKRQITAIEKVAAASYSSLITAPENQQSLSGSDLLTFGGTPLAGTPKPRKTPQQLAAELMAQINETVSPNKSALTPKTVREDAGQKMLDDARQRYAVLQQQSREIDAQGGSTKQLGAEQKKLIELEFELASLKEKKTLTASQKQVLAMGDMLLAAQKQNVAAEKSNELLKDRYEVTAKLKAYQDNIDSQAGLENDRYRSELAGAGLGDRAKQRAQESLKLQQDYQKKITKLTNDYTDSNDKSDSRKQIYEGNLAAESKALEDSLARQKQHYTDLDALRGNWLLGVSESWQNYVDIATDYNSQARAATESILADTTSSISGSIQNIIKGTESLGDAFGNLAGTMANSVIGALSDIAAKWVVVQALKLAGIGTETATTVASEATKTAAKLTSDAVTTTSSLAATATTTSAQVAAAGTTAAAWLPAALVASIGSFGAAAVVGGAALIAAYALIKGFSGGGYTGPGGVNEPAGMVHKGEIVWSQADIRRAGGVSTVEALRTGNVTPIASAQMPERGQARSQSSRSPQLAQQVYILNNSNAVVQTRSGEDGRLEVLIQAVEDRFTDQVAAGWGAFPQALEQFYAIRRNVS